MATCIGLLLCMAIIVVVLNRETKRGDNAENRVERYRAHNKVLRAENEKLRVELSKLNQRQQKS